MGVVKYKLDANCLSVKRIQAEVKRRGHNTQSAFTFEAFALSSFEDVERDEEVEVDCSKPFEHFEHAATQVSLRTFLVQQMTSEVRQQSEAALTAARLDMESQDKGVRDSSSDSTFEASAPATGFAWHSAVSDQMPLWRIPSGSGGGSAVGTLGAHSDPPIASLQLDTCLASIQHQCSMQVATTEIPVVLAPMPVNCLEALLVWEHCGMGEVHDKSESFLLGHSWLEAWAGQFSCSLPNCGDGRNEICAAKGSVDDLDLFANQTSQHHVRATSAESGWSDESDFEVIKPMQHIPNDEEAREFETICPEQGRADLPKRAEEPSAHKQKLCRVSGSSSAVVDSCPANQCQAGLLIELSPTPNLAAWDGPCSKLKRKCGHEQNLLAPACVKALKVCKSDVGVFFSLPGMATDVRSGVSIYRHLLVIDADSIKWRETCKTCVWKQSLHARAERIVCGHGLGGTEGMPTLKSTSNHGLRDVDDMCSNETSLINELAASSPVGITLQPASRARSVTITQLSEYVAQHVQEGAHSFSALRFALNHTRVSVQRLLVGLLFASTQYNNALAIVQANQTHACIVLSSDPESDYADCIVEHSPDHSFTRTARTAAGR